MTAVDAVVRIEMLLVIERPLVMLPTDVPGIKSYKAKTKKRIFEIARLNIIVRREVDREDGHPSPSSSQG